jgi:hypothetical protein
MKLLDRLLGREGSATDPEHDDAAGVLRDTASDESPTHEQTLLLPAAAEVK